MDMALSHHSSNPLEAATSDALNTAYNRTYTAAAFSSDDELGHWENQQSYINHIHEVVGRADMTPKAGPSRGAHFRPSKPMVDLDENMSDDELSLPFSPDRTTIDPRKEFNTDQGQVYIKKEEGEDEYLYVEGDEDYEREEEVLLVDPDDPDYANYYDDDLADYHPDEDAEMRDDDERHPGSLSPISSIHSSPFSSPQSSRPPSPDESRTLYSRPEDEQSEIEAEMESLNKTVPEIKQNYKLVDRLGTGTFSSVYKAIDVRYEEWYNLPWLGHHPPESTAHYQSAGPGYKGRGGRAPRRHLEVNGNVDADTDMDADGGMYPEAVSRYQPKDGKVYVAVKRIYTTSGPERIRNELSIMETCRGCRHSSQIMTAFRNKDQVVIVLPYQRNMDFRDFYPHLHPEGIKCYFRCLFRALRDIHARGIIHRDVKPANFLYDPFTGIGTLCDFGLASRMEHGSLVGRCLHTAASAEDPHGRTLTLDQQQTALVKRAQVSARDRCKYPAEKVGYPETDRRPVSKANRAGTRGFRAPEVLLKCGAQSGAIDVWSAGIILLFFLTGKFPIFQSNDDIEGLMEIAVILGKKNIEKVATLHGRTITTNVPGLNHDGITWAEFVKKLNPDIMQPRKYDMRYYPHNCKHRDGRGSTTTGHGPPLPPPSSSSPTSADLALPPTNGIETQPLPPPPSDVDTDAHAIHSAERYANPPSIERHTKELERVFALLEHLLHFQTHRRATPRDALYHSFLEEPGVEKDDAFIPHRWGEGVCGRYHTKDDVTEQMFVKVLKKCLCLTEEAEGSSGEGDKVEGEGEWCGDYVEVHEEVSAGEGIAIGNKPCEFHRGPLYHCE